MRVRHIVTRDIEDQYRSSLLNRDLGIYHMQTGSGIGGFLGKMFKSLLIPIGKSVFETLKPSLKKLGQKAITHVATSAYDKIGVKPTRKAVKKRKRDALVTKPYKRT